MIAFIIKHEGIEHTIEIEDKETILELKEKIMKQYNVSSQYIDIDFKLDKPIRTLGMFNFEPGIMPRTFDRYLFNRFNIDGRTIHAEFKTVDGYTQKIVKKVNSSKGSYRPPSCSVKSGDVVEGTTFDITSNDDFPALGQ